MPTGRVVATEGGADLILKRKFNAPIDDVWKSVTESEHTAKWFGRWEGEAGTGRNVTLYMGFEKEAAPARVSIEACRPPHHLAVTMNDAYGDWRLELSLEQSGSETTLTFTHHLTDAAMAGDTGPGWEYYLDMLVASRNGDPMPVFNDYYPAQKDYFLAQIRKE